LPRGLAKNTEPFLKGMIAQLLEIPQKMTVLRLLEKQMRHFLETGKTDPLTFRDDLENEELFVEGEPLSTSEDISSFVSELQNSESDVILDVKNSGFTFQFGSLSKLSPPKWFNDELILACLHLADKLPFVRVGVSVPIHQQTRRGAMSQPFEKAAKLIEKWQSEAETPGLICLFPIFQRGNHFSLLEINEKEGSIYHYDSLSDGQNTDIMVRAVEEAMTMCAGARRELKSRAARTCNKQYLTM
jgi:hypothetical protein